MKRIKKPVSILLPIIIIIQMVAAFPVIASASAPDPSKMTFEEYIVTSIENFTESIDIGYYVGNNAAWARDAKADANAFARRISKDVLDIIFKTPHLFHLAVPASASTSVNWTTTRGVDTWTVRVVVAYGMTRTQYNQHKTRFDTAVNRALTYARAAENDFEKALLLHDYIVLNTAYDKENLEHAIKTGMKEVLNPLSHTAFGALVNGLAVCDGYARAYMHLLNLVGVESRLVTGNLKGVSHIWNIVRIDNRWYHVDTTANDPLFDGVFDLHGAVSHRYFLLSDAGLRRQLDNNGRQSHTGWSVSGVRLNATNFDNAWFREINTAIIKLGDFYYWVEATLLTRDNVRTNGQLTANNRLRRYNIAARNSQTVHSFAAVWFTNGTENNNNISFTTSSYSRIAVYNGRLYFNTAKEILSYNPATDKVETVVSPANMGGTGNRFIFGLTISGRVISYTIKTQAGMADSFARFSITPQANSTAIRLDRTTHTIKNGASFDLVPTLTPAASKDFIHWVSSDTSIATVNANGRVTAVGRGTVTITAITETNRRRECVVTVT